MSDNQPTFAPATSFAPTTVLYAKQTFGSFDTAKIAITHLSLAQRKASVKAEKAPTGSRILSCALKKGDGCKYRVYLKSHGASGGCIVQTLIDEHTCSPHGVPARLGARQRGFILAEATRLNKGTPLAEASAKGLIGPLRASTIDDLSRQAVSRATDKPLDGYRERRDGAGQGGDGRDSEDGDSGDDDEEDVAILGLFVSPSPARTFFHHSRPLLTLDGTYSRAHNTYNLLLASTSDCEGHIVILAWALVKSESTATWSWFCQNLLVALPSLAFEGVVIVSDRQKGLLNAVGTVLPAAHHGHCAQHLRANIKEAYKAKAVDSFNSMLYAKTEVEFKQHLSALESENPDAAFYINSIPHDQWATYAFPLPRYGTTTSNTSEQCNNWLGPLRSRPIVELLQGIWDLMAQNWVERSLLSTQHNGTNCPFAFNWLTSASDAVRHDVVITQNDEAFTTGKTIPTALARIMGVYDHADQQRWVVVNWATRSATCTCGIPRQHMLPCKHVVAVLEKVRASNRVKDLAGPQYRSASWRQAYSVPFAVILTDDLATLEHLQPFPIRMAHGRKRQKRGTRGVRPTEASQREIPAFGGQGKRRGRPAGAPQHCARCKKEGHNTRKCPDPAFDDRYAAFF